MKWWEFWKKTGQKADFVQSFLDLNNEPMPQFRSIDQLSFVVLDTETSGFEVANDHVLSFGAVKIQELKIKVSQSIELFPNTQKFEELGYREAAEMTYFGASVIHPKTIKPLANAGLILILLNWESKK